MLNPRQDMPDMHKKMTKMYEAVLYNFPQLRLYSRQNHLTNSRELLTVLWASRGSAGEMFPRTK